MKKPLVLLLLILFAIGCKNEAKLTFKPLEIQGDGCDQCPEVAIELPKALDNTATARAINIALTEEVIELLSFDEESDITTIPEAVQSFTRSYQELIKKFPDETANWEATLNGEVIYEDAGMLSLVLNAYSFTGGAHGYGSTTFLNFDKQKGTELDNGDLFKDREGFEALAESKFRAQEKIPDHQNINSTGFMFERDAFHLAETIGYTPDGIQMVYNQYEIASYADGPIVLTLPYDEANPYLNQKVKP